ncbi:MAG: LPXTG cell wall anchor domain-containing protein, partial [Streptomyces sp.]|nr:LPXTG cell wall anchor domain-containing protein [Streptomyces sp.]
TLDVTAASGSSGGTQSDSDTSDSGAALPQTGPEDSAIALGTLGGTVLLAGAAGALWLTRRNQAVRARR